MTINLKEGRQPEKLIKLLEIYEKNPQEAKMFYRMSDNEMFSFIEEKLTIKDGNVYFFSDHRKVGISKSNRRYTTRKRVEMMMFKNHKNYYHSKFKGLKPLTLNDVKSLVRLHKATREHVINKYPWLRNFLEAKHLGRLSSVSLNYIQKHKLFNVKDLAAKVYGVPRPIAMELITFNEIDKRFWTKYKDTIICNVIHEETKEMDIIKDTIEMAYKLDKKVNLAWSPKRMKEEHDNFSKELLNIQMKLDNRELKVKDIYKKFADWVGSNYELITNSARLAWEGKMMKHCVGGYDNHVDRGTCAILRVGGHTLEVHGRNGVISIGQLKGISNAKAPSELMQRIIKDVNDFNKSIEGQVIEEPKKSLKYKAADVFTFQPGDLHLQQVYNYDEY